MTLRPPLTLSKSVIRHMKQLITSDASFILIGTKGGGCNGLKYYIEPIAAPEKLDVVFQEDGLNIAVCGKSLLHLINTDISWKVDSMGARIEFNNPNASAKCGCGETFNIK